MKFSLMQQYYNIFSWKHVTIHIFKSRFHYYFKSDIEPRTPGWHPIALTTTLWESRLSILLIQIYVVYHRAFAQKM